MYCGALADSDEHIIAVWIVNLLSKDPRGLQRRRLFVFFSRRAALHMFAVGREKGNQRLSIRLAFVGGATADG